MKKRGKSKMSRRTDSPPYYIYIRCFPSLAVFVRGKVLVEVLLSRWFLNVLVKNLGWVVFTMFYYRDADAVEQHLQPPDQPYCCPPSEVSTQ